MTVGFMLLCRHRLRTLWTALRCVDGSIVTILWSAIDTGRRTYGRLIKSLLRRLLSFALNMRAGVVATAPPCYHCRPSFNHLSRVADVIVHAFSFMISTLRPYIGVAPPTHTGV